MSERLLLARWFSVLCWHRGVGEEITQIIVSLMCLLGGMAGHTVILSDKTLKK